MPLVLCLKVCAASWLYSTSMALPPLVGWSRFVPEGLHTSCSWDYTTRSVNNTSYYVYLLTLGFFLPVSVICYCYIFIIIAILAHGKEMAAVKVDYSEYSKSAANSLVYVTSRYMLTILIYLKHIPTSIY